MPRERLPFKREHKGDVTINIAEIFRRFKRDVIKDKKLISEQALKEDENKRISELVDLFFTCLTSPKDAYLHPNKKNVVVVRGEEVDRRYF